MVKVAVLGATGYTGAELVRLLYGHPDTELVFLSSGQSVGEPYSKIHPQFYGQIDLELKAMKAEDIPKEAAFVFCALPHGKSAAVVPALLKKGFKVIDLSADFRLRDPLLYQTWYNFAHPKPSLLAQAAYGLPELNSASVSKATLVANPGCYPTGATLALAPLFKNELIKKSDIIIDAKSGVSGAGRSPKPAFHFPDCTENFKAYRVAGHQHTAEIEQELALLAGSPVTVTFTPHLVPMVRGILSTIYCTPRGKIKESDLLALARSFFKESPFVRVLEEGELPETRLVRGTNYIDLAYRYDKRTNKVIAISAIDNLVKGAAGQAVQNMNLMLGRPEKTGLEQIAL